MNAGVYINAAWHIGKGEILQHLCPATGNTVWQGPAAAAGQITEAVKSARTAFEEWSQTPLCDRISILNKYSKALAARRADIARVISTDMGKPRWESTTEAEAMVAKVEVSIRALQERAGTRIEPGPKTGKMLTHKPHGVMAVIGPFNFPGHLPNGHIVPALLAGNTCVFKPSEHAPGVAELMAAALVEAGLPADCFNIVQGGRNVATALLDQPINGVLFTGSVHAGLSIHRHFAGRPDVILALEMGGNNPLLVWEPAAVQQAADIIFQSAYLTSGQRCSCARRLILPTGDFGDAVIEATIGKIQQTKIGAWDEPDVFMGPVITAQAANNIVQSQSALEKSGGRILLAAKILARGKAFVAPGLIDVTNVIDIKDEEIFGPLLQVFRVDSYEQALQLAGQTRFGLAAGLVCDDETKWRQAQMSLRVGILNWNCPTVGASADLPFGGPGLSGNFRPGAYYAADYCAWPQASQLKRSI